MEEVKKDDITITRKQLEDIQNIIKIQANCVCDEYTLVARLLHESDRNSLYKRQA